MKKISIIVPCYNEEQAIPFFYDEITKIAEEMKRFAKEVDLGKCVSEFYNTLANRLILMMERQPNWDYITFEGP